MNKNKNLIIQETFNLAVKNHQEGKTVIAQDLYNQILKIDPSHSQSLSNIGVIFTNLKEHQKAKDCFEKAIEINPSHTNAHNNLGNIFLELEENQKAKECYEKAIKINPNFTEAYNNLGNMLKEQDRLKEAEANYKKAIMLEPDFINLVNSVDKGDWQNSKNILTKVCINKIINMKKYIDEFISLWCLYCNKLLREGDIKKFTQIFIKLLIMGERNHNLNRLIKFLFKTVDINTILKLVESNDKILIKVSYCQYRFENGDFLQSEKLAATNIQDTKSLIKNTETEDLGWLVVRRSLALCKNKNFARKTLNNLLAP